MGLYCPVSCPDCDREWNGLETSFRFGPWSLLEYPAIDDGFRSWFCPRCNFRIYFPRTIERSVWRRWYEAILNGPDGGDAFLGASAGHQQPPVQVVSQLAQRVTEELHPPITRRRLEARVEHEASEHIVAGCGGPQKRREIAQSEVATKPQHCGHQRLTGFIDG